MVLNNDAVRPEDDPDSDGASNVEEFAALTDPRNPADVLRTEITRTGAGLTVRWRSVAGQHYQLFQTSDLNAGVWTPAGARAAGTGELLQVAVGVDSAATFYRVQALP